MRLFTLLYNVIPIRGQQIRTPMDGEVVYTSPNIYSCGYYVVETDCFYVGTGERIRVGFMHMQGGGFYDPGDRVEKWDNLQNVGNSGTSDGFHHLDLSVFLTGDWAEKCKHYNP